MSSHRYMYLRKRVFEPLKYCSPHVWRIICKLAISRRADSLLSRYQLTQVHGAVELKQSLRKPCNLNKTLIVGRFPESFPDTQESWSLISAAFCSAVLFSLSLLSTYYLILKFSIFQRNGYKHSKWIKLPVFNLFFLREYNTMLSINSLACM